MTLKTLTEKRFSQCLEKISNYEAISVLYYWAKHPPPLKGGWGGKPPTEGGEQNATP